MGYIKIRHIKKHLESDELTERQRETIQRFDKYKVDVRDWNSVHTRFNNAKCLCYLGSYCLKPYEDMTEEDILNFLNSRNINEGTRSSYIITFRCFFSWLYGLSDGQYPDCVSNLKPKKVPSKLTKSDLITEEDTKRMIVCALNPRDRAIPPVLKEGAFRPHEFLSINVGDVEERDYGFYVSCRDSKTILRGVPIIWSARYLGEWLNHHPHRDDPEAPLWIALSRKSGFDKRLEVSSLNCVVNRLARRAGIKKRVYAYLFRHSGATDMVIDNIHVVIMSKICGWSPTSAMPARYVHLAGVDVENAVLKARGVKVEPRKRMMEPKFCPRCEEENGPELTYCGRCGTNLDKPAHAYDETSRQEKEKVDYEALKEKIKKDIMRDLGLQPPEEDQE